MVRSKKQSPKIVLRPDWTGPWPAYLNYGVVQYMRMTQKLEVFKSTFKEHSSMHDATIAALKKLDEYYTLATNQQRSHSTIATICDPRYTFNIFDIIWPKSTHDARK